MLQNINLKYTQVKTIIFLIDNYFLYTKKSDIFFLFISLCEKFYEKISEGDLDVIILTQPE